MVKEFLNTTLNLSWYSILWVKGINSEWAVLYSQGFILTLSACIALGIQMRALKPFIPLAKDVAVSVQKTGLTLLVTLIMVQVFSNSGMNNGQLPLMSSYIANTLSEYLSGVWVFIAPFIEELGSFVTGSATVSNLTFASVQFDIAQYSHLPMEVVLSSQVIGAAAGNMICVFNIVAVSGGVGLFGKEGQILRKIIVPALIYGFLVALAATLYIFWRA